MLKEYAKPSVLVETTWVADHQHDIDLRIIEVDVNRTAYDAGHIPGASLWVVYQDLLQPDQRLRTDAAELSDLIAKAGIDDATTVVFYSGANVANMPATFGFWLLHSLGYTRLHLMNGGRKKWVAEGRPLTTAIPATSRRAVAARTLNSRDRATRADVSAALGRSDTTLLDVRQAREYAGELFSPGQPPKAGERAGHIPGAVHMPFELALAADGRFRDAPELSVLFAGHGVTPEKRVIPYCTVGGRSSFSWFVLTQLLGYPDVRLYEASWAEWGTLADTPVEV